MILIIGGYSQGKAAFAKRLFKIETEDSFEQQRADGKNDSLQDAFKKPVIIGFHHYIGRILEQNQDVQAFTSLVIEAGPQIVVMDEVGYGIVPMEKKDRSYREAVGRAGQMLAAEADIVYRVVCGIGTRIKG